MKDIIIVGLLLFILYYIGGQIISKFSLKKEEKALKKSIEKLDKRIQIKNELDMLRIKLGCLRTSIIDYDAQLVMSTMKYESVAPGTAGTIQAFQGINSMVCLPMIHELERNGFVKVDKNSGEDLVRLHRAIGVGTSYKYKLGNTIMDGNLIVAFSEDHELTPKEAEEIYKTLKTLKTIYGNRT